MGLFGLAPSLATPRSWPPRYAGCCLDDVYIEVAIVRCLLSFASTACLLVCNKGLFGFQPNHTTLRLWRAQLVAVELDAILVTTTTHLLHARRQAAEANDKGQRTVAASMYTPSKQQPAYRGGYERGVASDGTKLNGL